MSEPSHVGNAHGVQTAAEKQSGKDSKMKYYVIGGLGLVAVLVFVFVHKSNSSSSGTTSTVAGYGATNTNSLLTSLLASGLGTNGNTTAGATGPAGAVGATGPAGAAGTAGLPGASGKTGATGPAAAAKIAVPNVIGMTAGAADKLLDSLGLHGATNGIAANEIVTQQSYANGTQASKGAVVNLTAMPPKKK